MAYRRTAREFRSIRELANNRAVAVIQCVNVLLPDGDERRRKRICKKILSLCDGKDRRVRITEAQLFEMVVRNSQCISKVCPLLIFAEPLSRELNAFFNEEE
jgi:hypothetical protein